MPAHPDDSTPVLFDAHLHLPEGADREPARNAAAAMFDRARAAGVRLFAAVGTNLESSQRAAAVAECESGVFATVGLHPHEAAEFDGDMAPYIDLVGHPQVVAIGEIGLDYHYDFSPRPAQRRVFRAFLELAVRHHLPVVVHCREAYDDCLAILRDALPSGYPVLMHSFTGPPEELSRFLPLDACFSFNGIVTFRNAEDVRASLRNVPPERIMLETDSPYLAPHPRRGRTNEPALLPYVAEGVARVLGWSVEEVARRTTTNACRFYRVSADGFFAITRM